MQKLMNNANVAQVQEIPCSLCFSRNHADGELTERIDAVFNYTLICVTNKAKLTNLMIELRIEGYNGK